MDYKYSKSNKNIKNVDIHLIGVFDNKQITHLDKWISKSTYSLIETNFTNNNFTGKLGDHRTFDDLDNNIQILFFGLGSKEKFNPIIFSDFKTSNLIFFVSNIFLSSPLSIFPEGNLSFWELTFFPLTITS